MFFTLIASTFTYVGCEKEPDVITEEAARTILDISYGNGEKQKMDVYLPANRSTEDTRVLIYIHGGSFIAGDRKEVPKAIIDYILNKGWAVVNVSYRLVDGAGLAAIPPTRVESGIVVSDQVDDIAAVVDVVLSSSRDWAVNGHRVGVAGHSAGGTLALLYAYDDRNTNRIDNTRKVKAAGNWAGALDLSFEASELSGITDFLRYFVLEFTRRLTGHEWNPLDLRPQQRISPYHVANADKRVPTINIFPEHNDVMGLPKQDRETYDLFTQKLQQLQIPNRFMQIDGADHGFGPDPANWITVIDQSLDFFGENML